MPTSPRYGPYETERRDTTDRQDGVDPRTPFEVDRARIVHSSAFRRLQGKTQIFGVGESDFYRTRLTHSMETAQVGKGLALYLNLRPELRDAPLAPELIETACLAHDLGHPPFGHNGEAALQACMHAHGGFEGNAQTLRVVMRLEAKREHFGLNLTRATLDALMKYLVPYTARKRARSGETAHLAVEKCYYDVDEPLVSWIRREDDRRYRTLESEVMEWADDVAYSVHDLEDGLHSGMILAEHFDNVRVLDRIAQAAVQRGAEGCTGGEVKSYMRGIFAQLESGTARHAKLRRKKLTSTLIHRAVTHTGLVARQDAPARYALGLAVDPAIQREVAMLKAVEWVLLIRHPRVTTLEYKGKLIVTNLFRALAQDLGGDLLPEDIREDWEEARMDEATRLRVICDYVAGMTDAYALKLYARLFEPGAGSLGDLL